MFRKPNRQPPPLSDVQLGISQRNRFQRQAITAQRRQEKKQSLLDKLFDFLRRLFGRKVVGKRIFKYHWDRPTTTTKEKDRAKVKRRKVAYRSMRINRLNGSAKR